RFATRRAGAMSTCRAARWHGHGKTPWSWRTAPAPAATVTRRRTGRCAARSTPASPTAGSWCCTSSRRRRAADAGASGGRQVLAPVRRVEVLQRTQRHDAVGIDGVVAAVVVLL